MAIEIRDLDGGIGNTIIATGTVTGQEYVETHRTHVTQDEEKFRKHRYSLCDWTGVTKPDVPTHDIQIVADLCLHASQANQDAVVAIVARQDVVFGSGRVYAVLTQKTGWEIMIAGRWTNLRLGFERGLGRNSELRT